MFDTLKTPMLSSESNVSDWMHSYIRQEKSQGENTIRNCVRTTSKCALAAIALVRNIAFMPVSLKMHLPHNISWLFASGNVIGVTALDYWAGTRFIDDSLPQEAGLRQNFPTKKTPLLHRAATVANVVISLLAQIPSVYPVMQYNGSSVAIPAAIVVMLGGAVLPLRSIQLSIEKYFNLTSAKKQGIDPLTQEHFVKLIKENRQRFINMSKEDKALFISDLDAIRELDDSPLKLKAYWNHLLSITPPPTLKPLSGISYGSTELAKVTGFIFTGIYQYVIGVYTFAKTKENVWNNDGFAGVTAGLVVASTSYLMGKAMIDASVKVFHSITGINKKAYESQVTLAEKFRKKTMIALQFCGVGINLLSLGATYVLWRDFFKDQTHKTFFETTMCCAIFLLLHAAIPDVINDCMEQTLLSVSGTPEEKAAIKLSREYQMLADSIDKLAPEDFKQLSTLLPQELLSFLKTELHSPVENDSSEVSLHQYPQINSNPMQDDIEKNLGKKIIEDELDSVDF